MLLVLAAIVDQKVELLNRTFCAPGTKKSVFSGIEICEPIPCADMSIDVCAADQCTAGAETQVSKCATCLNVSYLPQAGQFGICAYKCSRNSTMHDCFHLLGVDYCNGRVSVHNADTNASDFIDAICQVCAAGQRPTADALNCEDAGIPAERQVAGCLQYSTLGEGYDAQNAVCVDCGIQHCERCENASAREPMCAQCSQGYVPLFGQCAQSTAGCAQYSAGTLRCARCLDGYVLFSDSQGFPACALASNECGAAQVAGERCIAVIDAIGQVSHKLASLGVLSGSAACDCVSPLPECAEACGFCAPGYVFLTSEAKCGRSDTLTVQFCLKMNGSRCLECAAGFQLFDDGHACLYGLQRCSANKTLSGGVACVCDALHERNDVGECVLRNSSCGEHGKAVNNSCICERGFAGRFCELCEGKRVLSQGVCRNYRAVESMWWSFFTLVLLGFLLLVAVLAARGWFSGVFRTRARSPRDDAQQAAPTRAKEDSKSYSAKASRAQRKTDMQVVF